MRWRACRLEVSGNWIVEPEPGQNATQGLFLHGEEAVCREIAQMLNEATDDTARERQDFIDRAAIEASGRATTHAECLNHAEALWAERQRRRGVVVCASCQIKVHNEVRAPKRPECSCVSHRHVRIDGRCGWIGDGKGDRCACRTVPSPVLLCEHGCGRDRVQGCTICNYCFPESCIPGAAPCRCRGRAK